MVMENGNLAMEILLGGSSCLLFLGPFGILKFGFWGGRKTGGPGARNACYASSKNGTWARAVEYEPSHHCAIPTTH